MIKAFCERWDNNKSKIRDALVKHPDDYIDLVKLVIQNITTKEYEDYAPDPERIHKIDDGNHEGTLLFVIAEKGYLPSKYYSVYVDYGSCSGCDTLQSINDYSYSSEPPTEEQKDLYMMLCLHIVQKLKRIE